MKQLLLLNLCAFCLLSANAQIPGNGMVVYFPFNGNVKDSSPNKTNGTAYNVSLAKDRFGKDNSAYSFAGTTDSYIEFPTTNVLNNTYTYSLWVKINTVPGDGDYSFALNIGGTGGDQNINTANNVSGMYDGWIGGGYNTSPPNYVVNEYKTHQTSTWDHIVCVRAANYVLLYINGELVDSVGTNSNTTPFYGTSNIKAMIGVRNNYTKAFHGLIDEVLIYDRALSKQEVESIYTVQSTNTSLQSISFIRQFIKVYPNPNNADFNIDLSGIETDSETLTVKISNLLGQDVFEQNFTFAEVLSVNSGLSKGQYIVSILDSQNRVIATEKMIIN